MRQSLLGLVTFFGLALIGGGALAADSEELLGEMSLGSPDAPVTIVEHSSFTCDHCGYFYRNTLPKIKEAYIVTGKARFVFRDFPLDRMALAVAMLPHCAGPNRYFDFVEILFRGQESWLSTQNQIKALGQRARLGGMSNDDFEACLNRQDLAKAILDRREADAGRLGIESTPTFFVNGEKIVGARSFEEFARVIDQALEKAK